MPSAVVPELNITAPLTPVEYAFADRMRTAPEEL